MKIGNYTLSAFDLGMIIAFVVVTGIGGGACYYLSTQLDAVKQDVSGAQGDFEKYSSREVYLPTAPNQKTLEADIALMQGELDPLVKSELQAPGNNLPTAAVEDTVKWKHDLDAKVSELTEKAKVHGVSVPDHFYFGFSRYLNQNPGEDQTLVLTKQLDGIAEIANIFCDAPVKGIYGIRRTYEEDEAEGVRSSGGKSDTDLLPGRAQSAPGDVYTAYPLEIEFETNTESFRKVVAALQKSPYVFVIRSVMLKSSALDSPEKADLDKLAAPPPDATPDPTTGAVPKSTKGPQFLFGNETLHVKMRLDMVEWHGVATSPSPGGPGGRGRAPGGGR